MGAGVGLRRRSGMDLLDLFERGSGWAASKVRGATQQLDQSTGCEDWNVRALLDHMVDALRYFNATARGEEASLPDPSPPPAVGDDPVSVYEAARQETLDAYGEPGVVDKTGPLLGIAFVDQLVHGWDLAKATGQDANIPDDLAQAAFSMIDGQLTDDRRGNGFKPAVEVGADASIQERLVAYTGRQP
jgi:uncharacterized protein (TIGR03086 family)